MNVLKIGYSKLKVSLALILTGYLAIFPFILPLFVPGIYGFADKSMSDVFIVVVMLMIMSVIGFSILALILKKVSSSRHGVILSEQGISSYISGFSERLFAWDEVVEARKINSAKGPDFVRLIATSDKTETGLIQSGTVLWHMVLEVSAQELVEAINTYKKQIDLNAGQNIVEKAALNDHMNKAA